MDAPSKWMLQAHLRSERIYAQSYQMNALAKTQCRHSALPINLNLAQPL